MISSGADSPDSAPRAHPAEPSGGKAQGLVSRVFALNRKGLNLTRGFTLVAVMLLPLAVLTAFRLDTYWLSLAFGVLFVALSDPGGTYAVRVREMLLITIGGGLLTLWAFAVGSQAWGWVTVSVFVVVLVTSLGIKFGAHRFVSGILLSVWFLVVLTLPGSYAADHADTTAWAQTVAWLAGGALWTALTAIGWLAKGRTRLAPPIPEIPTDMTTVNLTRPMVLFALIRAVVVSAAVAFAFGLHLPYADWMPIAALTSMKPDLQRSSLAAVQRLVGVTIGAVFAAAILLTVRDKYALMAIVLAVAVLPGAVRTVNYALYNAAIAALVLIALDVPHPTNLHTEGLRILFTLLGVGLAVLVMFLADWLQRRAAPTSAHTGP